MSNPQLFKQTLLKIRKSSGDTWDVLSAKVGYSRSYLAQMGAGGRTITADVCLSIDRQYRLTPEQRATLMQCCDLVNLRELDEDQEKVAAVRKLLAVLPGMQGHQLERLHIMLDEFSAK